MLVLWVCVWFNLNFRVNSAQVEHIGVVFVIGNLKFYKCHECCGFIRHRRSLEIKITAERHICRVNRPFDESNHSPGSTWLDVFCSLRRKWSQLHTHNRSAHCTRSIINCTARKFCSKWSHLGVSSTYIIRRYKISNTLYSIQTRCKGREFQASTGDSN